jgi:WD40 repeat protein
MDQNTLEKCHVFICYRQQDGLDAADWLYNHLHGRTIQLERSNETLQLDVYLDRDAPAVDNWQEIWLPKLQVARALIFVCTPSAARQRDGTDWVYRELDKWIAMRQSGPIVIDATGEADKYLPRIIQERWPNAQRIACRPDVLAQLPEAKHQQETERIVGRILRGIRISEEGYWIEELERLKALNRKLVRRLIAAVALFGLALVFAVLFRMHQVRAEREATIAIAGQLTATSDFLRQQEGPSLETSVLLAKRAYQMRSQVGVPSIDAWRALNNGIELLPGKIGQPLYPFGPGVPVRAYVGKTAVLFLRQKRAATNSEQAGLWSFDGDTGTWQHIRGFSAGEHGEAVSANMDGHWMVSRRSGEFVVRNTWDGEVIRSIALSAGEELRARALLSPAGRYLAMADSSGFYVYDLQAAEKAPGRSFPIVWIDNCAFSPDERYLADAAPDRLTLYNPESGDVLRRTRMPPGTDQVGPPMFSPDGAYVALHLAMNQTFQAAPSATPGGVNYKVYVWPVPKKAMGPVSAAADRWQPYEVILRDKRFDVVFGQSRVTPKLAILDRSQPVQLLDLFSKVSFTLSAGDQGARSAAFESGRLLTVNRDGTARLWDTQQRIELRRLTHRRPVGEAHFLKGSQWGGAQALTVSDDGEVRLWGPPEASLVIAASLFRVLKWGPSGDWILSADSRALRIDARNGEKKQIPLQLSPGHRCIAGALSPDGRYAAFATKWAPPGAPQTLRLVDINREHGQIDLPLEGREVSDLTVAPGGSPVIAATEKGAVLIWHPPCGLRRRAAACFKRSRDSTRSNTQNRHGAAGILRWCVPAHFWKGAHDVDPAGAYRRNPWRAQAACPLASKWRTAPLAKERFRELFFDQSR